MARGRGCGCGQAPAADCNWPADTDLAFAAWVDEPEQAGLPAVYALASVQRRRT